MCYVVGMPERNPLMFGVPVKVRISKLASLLQFVNLCIRLQTNAARLMLFFRSDGLDLASV